MRSISKTRSSLVVLAVGLALAGAANAQDAQPDEATRKALERLAEPGHDDVGFAGLEGIVSSPAYKSVAATLGDLLKKVPEHTNHVVTCRVLGRVLEAHLDLAPPIEALVAVAGHDDPRCLKAALGVLTAALRRKPPSPLAPEVDARVEALLETRVEGLFVEIDRFAKDHEVEKLVPCFTELDEIMRAYKRPGRDVVEAKLKQWDKRLEEWKEIRLAIKLQLYINDGNAHLKAMLKAMQQEKFDDVSKTFVEVQALVDKMRHEERDEFHKNADAILQRATQLRDESVTLARIRDLKLVVSAIVIDPRPESRNRAIVHFEGAPRIYEEGDKVHDREGKIVEDLTLVKIVEGSVKFHFRDTDFVRELRAP